MARQCVKAMNGEIHGRHVFGLDVKQGGWTCNGIEAPREKQCGKQDPHPPHQWRASREHDCPGIKFDVGRWVQRLTWLLRVQGERETCFCESGWPDRDCPVHFRENSYSEMLKAEAVLAVPVLLAEIKRQWNSEPRPCMNTKCNGYVAPAEWSCDDCGSPMGPEIL